ncbi:uncharacterized protein LOC124167039 [Ischnura elegans]|uniref:uncharacterized protein LOC124167039 n=1 Tax=Ischnura elegans TaxID=197161 RepID=UPI001ED8AA4C|nr:uncharacterized protein LOC124167039 [Ischnura elegans]
MLKHMLTATAAPVHSGYRPQSADCVAAAMGADMHGGARMRGGGPQPMVLTPNGPMNMSHRMLNHSHALNVSTLSTSKHSLGGNSSSISPGANLSKNLVGMDASGVSHHSAMMGGNMSGLELSPHHLHHHHPHLAHHHMHHQSPQPVPQTQIPHHTQVHQQHSPHQHSPHQKMANGGLNIPRRVIPTNVTRFMHMSKVVGVRESLTSLGLLCLVSLLLALLSLIFLLKISPATADDVRDLLRTEQFKIISAEEYVVVYEVTLALCALTLSLNLCCLLVCAVQFLFAVKLVKSPQGAERTNKYLQKSSITRVCAVGGFFISIPVFLTGIILYTFIQFHSTPAIITSVFIGLGIIFCGCAMVHNVFVWQKEKTNAARMAHQHVRSPSPDPLSPLAALAEMKGSRSGMVNGGSHVRDAGGSTTILSSGLPSSSNGVPVATLDLSALSLSPTSPHELSTLV